MTAQIIKLPYSVTRAAFSRKPRKSKNGTPEERAAKATAGTTNSLSDRQRRPKRVITGDDWAEFVSAIGPDLQQAFMVDAWKLLNRYWRKL